MTHPLTPYDTLHNSPYDTPYDPLSLRYGYEHGYVHEYEGSVAPLGLGRTNMYPHRWDHDLRNCLEGGVEEGGVLMEGEEGGGDATHPLLICLLPAPAALLYLLISNPPISNIFERIPPLVALTPALSPLSF